jgi:uncharacterized protein with NRDE domain
LSNAALDVPWPKVIAGRDALRASLSDADAPARMRVCVTACRIDGLQTPTVALAEQGLNGDMARQLSAQFIVTPAYGTRCCTTLRCTHDGSRDFAEQRFDSAG